MDDEREVLTELDETDEHCDQHRKIDERLLMVIDEQLEQTMLLLLQADMVEVEVELDFIKLLDSIIYN